MNKPMNNENPEFDYARECLDKHGIKWSSVGNGSLLINVKGRSYYYYPTRNRWRAKGSNKEYSVRSIDYLIELLIDTPIAKSEGFLVH
ncbi:hypothetical protein MaMV-DH010060 [Cyanophage MaMV-DH01]|nr:hypothetical protein MaMV-DH010060 [Cyanophage MaMV-DH01]